MGTRVRWFPRLCVCFAFRTGFSKELGQNSHSVLRLLMTLSFLLFSEPLLGQSSSTAEYGAKATYLSNFPNFVEWPADAPPAVVRVVRVFLCSPGKGSYVFDFDWPNICRIAAEEPGARFSRQASSRLQVSSIL